MCKLLLLGTRLKVLLLLLLLLLKEEKEEKVFCCCSPIKFSRLHTDSTDSWRPPWVLKQSESVTGFNIHSIEFILE